MSTPFRHVRAGAAIGLAAVLAFAVAVPTLAKAGGNSAASAACEDGGYVNWTDEAGNPFRNAGACVSYAAHGGTLVPVVVVVSPFSVAYRASGTNGFVATVEGSGLEPDSSVDVVFTWGSTTMTLGNVADATGAISFSVSGVCSSLGSALTGVSVVGIPAGGEQTEYSFPLPDASICPAP
jgi:hypothetical protein